MSCKTAGTIQPKKYMSLSPCIPKCDPLYKLKPEQHENLSMYQASFNQYTVSGWRYHFDMITPIQFFFSFFKFILHQTYIHTIMIGFK